MTKFLMPLVLLVLVLSACDYPTPGNCDYCLVERPDVKRYKCEACAQAHSACATESMLLKSYFDVVSIMSCPNANALPQPKSTHSPKMDPRAPGK